MDSTLDDVLIKPTHSPKGEEDDEPFKTLMAKFKHRLQKNKVCFVVGFSFRDKRINEIFDIFMKQGGKLVIISPDATKEFTDNFIRDYQPNENNYTNIDEKVTENGIDGLINRIKSEL